jgi:hypothetical protein
VRSAVTELTAAPSSLGLYSTAQRLVPAELDQRDQGRYGAQADGTEYDQLRRYMATAMPIAHPLTERMQAACRTCHSDPSFLSVISHAMQLPQNAPL